VPFDRWAEYKARYGLELAQAYTTTEGGRTVIVVIVRPTQQKQP
jgi:hypothetical protein